MPRSAWLAAWLTGCSSQVTIVDDDERVPASDHALELVEGPLPLSGVLEGARVVGRKGGFDVVSGGDAIVAQRLEVFAEPDYLRAIAEPQTLVPGLEDLAIATARGDQLALCTRPRDGLSTLRQYSGYDVYEATAMASIGAWNDFSCNGLAWRLERGIVSWRLCPNDGGLCYAVVQEVDVDGVPTSQPTRALGDDETWVAGVSLYGDGLAWAGGMGGPLQVWFSQAPGQGLRVDVPSASPSDFTPRMSAWPFRDDAVAVVWDEARLVVIGNDGVTIVDRALVDPTTHRTTRPAIASNDIGLVTAHAECAHVAEQGNIVVTLWDARGEPAADAVRLPTACPTEASSLAIAADHVLVIWHDPTTDGYRRALLRIVAA